MSWWSGLIARTSEPATRAVIATLRELVPEEDGDVLAVLPTDLKPLWAAPLTTIAS